MTSSDKSAVVYVCLGGDDSGRVRGHFERIWKRNDFEESRIVWILECEMRAEEKQRQVAAAEEAAEQVAKEKHRAKQPTLRMNAEKKKSKNARFMPTRKLKTY